VINQKKSGNFTFQSQGKIRGSEKVSESQHWYRILCEQISQGKRFILYWKVRENEFCSVVGTRHLFTEKSASCQTVKSIYRHFSIFLRATAATALAHFSHRNSLSVRLSVCLFVHHTGGLVKNDGS